MMSYNKMIIDDKAKSDSKDDFVVVEASYVDSDQIDQKKDHKNWWEAIGDIFV